MKNTIETVLSEAFHILDVGILIENTQGGIKFVNTCWCNMRREEKEMLPINFRKKALSSPENTFTYSSDGTFLEVQTIPIKNMPYILWISRDLTKRVHLKEENYILREIIANVDEAVIMSDADNVITLYNKAHEILDHLSAEEVLGKPIDKIYKKEMHTQVAKSNIPAGDLYHSYLLENGRMINTLSSTLPMWHQDKFIGVYSISRDISFSKNLIRKMVELQDEVEGKRSTKPNGTRFSLDDIIGESVAMNRTKREAKKMAMSNSPIMICGETGTGKELFAQSIHNIGMYRDEPFVAINCAAVPENLLESTLFGTEKGSFTGAEKTVGLMEQAGKGTFFLDEINSMPLSMQSKLLRVLQEKEIRRVGGAKEIPIECRIISSCNQSPEKCVEDEILRLDLFYRLAILRLSIPPLRKRGGDIVLLAKYFAEKIGSAYGNAVIEFHDDFFTFLINNKWPGNVRELEFTIEGCVASAGNTSVLSTQNIPEYLNAASFVYHDAEASQNKEENLASANETLKDILSAAEKTAIETALRENHGNISQSARALGIGRQNLQYRIKKLGLQQ